MSDILEKNAGFKWLRNLNKRDGTARNFVLLRKVIRLSNRLVAAEKERDSWKAKAEANERIKKFVGKLLIDFMPEFGDIDGCYFQDEAFNHGLLKCVDSPSDDDRCSGCDGDCDYCYRLSPLGQEACDAARSAEKEK